MTPTPGEGPGQEAAARKWRVNAKKVAFVKAFPGHLKAWSDAVGKTVERVETLDGGKVDAIIFTDATFLFVPNQEHQPARLIQAVLALRPWLARMYSAAYDTLNDAEIPELRPALRRFLDEVDKARLSGEAAESGGLQERSDGF